MWIPPDGHIRSSPRWRFKKTRRGMVLMTRKKMSSDLPGEFTGDWVAASEHHAHDVLQKLLKNHTQLEQLKSEYPDLFI